MSNTLAGSLKKSILICDYEILGGRTGGQTYYTNLIENKPECTFSSLRETSPPRDIPSNFSVGSSSGRATSSDLQSLDELLTSYDPIIKEHINLAKLHRPYLHDILNAIAAQTFDEIDLPSYFPFAKVIRRFFSGTIRLTLHGMVSDGLLMAYETDPVVFSYAKSWRNSELSSLQLADQMVSVSQAHKAWVQSAFAPVGEIEVAPLETILPRSYEKLNLSNRQMKTVVLYVGRFDGIKKPHALGMLKDRIVGPSPEFVAMGSSLNFTQINTDEMLAWMYPTLLELRPPMPRWWRRYNADETIVVVPGWETLSYVAIEAVAHGFTVALSPDVGVRAIFDELSIPYLPTEGTSPIGVLPSDVREKSAERLHAGRTADKILRESVR